MSKGTGVRSFEDVLDLLFGNLLSTQQKPVAFEVKVPRKLIEEIMYAEADEDNGDSIEATNDFETARQEILDMATDEEIWALDTLDTFVHSPKVSLPYDQGSLTARLEHAEWNTNEYRRSLIETLATFEADIAYYAYFKGAGPIYQDELDNCLDDISASLEDIVYAASKLKLFFQIETAMFNRDTAEKEFTDSDVELEILKQLLADLCSLREDD